VISNALFKLKMPNASSFNTELRESKKEGREMREESSTKVWSEPWGIMAEGSHLL
jgi:hypothetical protein